MEKFLFHLPLLQYRYDIDRLGVGWPVAHNLPSVTHTDLAATEK